MSEEMTMQNEIKQETESIDNQEKMFTQSQLEEIISKRLDRERRMAENLKEIKSMLVTAKKEGLVEGSSYTEMAEELLNMARRPGIDNSDDMAKENTSMPCDNTSLNADKDGHETHAIEAEQTETEKETMGDFFSELRAIKEKHKGALTEKLLSGDIFEKFAKGRSGRASEIFDDFCLFMQVFDTGEHEEAVSENEVYDPYSSTSFSSFSDTESTYSGLTKQQMEMAKSAGLSYREYASILAGIPQKKNKNN